MSGSLQQESASIRFHVGCSGWSYKHWAGDFYPAGLKSGDWFSYYASHFDTVELNTTFYRLPREETVKRWRDLAPPQFLFAAKVSRLITHFRRLGEVEAALDLFRARLGHLAGNLGPLLVQLPPDFEIDLARLEGFLRLLPKERLWAFEFRNRSWWTDETYSLLSQHGASFCIYDRGRESAPAIATAPAVYIRFHGPAGADTGYDDASLLRWLERLRELPEVTDVFAYFNNDIGGHAPRDALRFRSFAESGAA